MRPFRPEDKFQPRQRETSYMIIERNAVGEERELQTINKAKPLSALEKLQELAKAFRTAFPKVKFTQEPDPQFGMRLINLETKATIYIKRIKN